MHEWAHCHGEAASHQLPRASAFWIIQIVSVEECSSLTHNLMQIHSSTHSIILNALDTQYTCSLNGTYSPHWLVQWHHHCSQMHIPVHSPWLPGYIDVTQTVLVILTMAGLLPDRPLIYIIKFCFFFYCCSSTTFFHFPATTLKFYFYQIQNHSMVIEVVTPSASEGENNGWEEVWGRLTGN